MMQIYLLCPMTTNTGSVERYVMPTRITVRVIIIIHLWQFSEQSVNGYASYGCSFKMQLSQATGKRLTYGRGQKIKNAQDYRGPRKNPKFLGFSNRRPRNRLLK